MAAQGAQAGAWCSARRQGHRWSAKQALEDVGISLLDLLLCNLLCRADSSSCCCSKVVRKSIALVLTVISQNQKKALREAYSKKV